MPVGLFCRSCGDHVRSRCSGGSGPLAVRAGTLWAGPSPVSACLRRQISLPLAPELWQCCDYRPSTPPPQYLELSHYRWHTATMHAPAPTSTPIAGPHLLLPLHTARERASRTRLPASPLPHIRLPSSPSCPSKQPFHIRQTLPDIENKQETNPTAPPRPPRTAPHRPAPHRTAPPPHSQRAPRI